MPGMYPSHFEGGARDFRVARHAGDRGSNPAPARGAGPLWWYVYQFRHAGSLCFAHSRAGGQTAAPLRRRFSFQLSN